MLVIGLTGGIGCGKSCVASVFAQLGAEVIDADRIGHELLLQDEVKSELKTRFGETVFLQNGEVNRGEIARMVFAPTKEGRENRLFLEELLHPKIAQKVRQRLGLAAQSQTQIVVLDAPLLLESNWAEVVDLIFFVDAPESVRLERVRLRGWNIEELRRRESTQWSLDRKRAMADVVIDNSGSGDQLNQSVLQIWKNLPQLAAKSKST